MSASRASSCRPGSASRPRLSSTTRTTRPAAPSHAGTTARSYASCDPRRRDLEDEPLHLGPDIRSYVLSGGSGGRLSWVKDHINLLCNGGRDAVPNMQWQPIADDRRLQPR